MYGSVRGVPGNQHSYRDKIISWLFNFTLTPFICHLFCELKIDRKIFG